MAHNPNINLLEQFCPCGCNANNAYTSVASVVCNNQCPRSDIEWNNWWKCPNSWEEPFLSRTSPSPVWTAVEQGKLFDSLNQRVEKILVRRMLPQYKKSVPRLVVGSLEPRLWTTWVRYISNGAPWTEAKQRNLKVVSHLPKKQNVCHSRVVWKVFMPNCHTSDHSGTEKSGSMLKMVLFTGLVSQYCLLVIILSQKPSRQVWNIRVSSLMKLKINGIQFDHDYVAF